MGRSKKQKQHQAAATAKSRLNKENTFKQGLEAQEYSEAAISEELAKREQRNEQGRQNRQRNAAADRSGVARQGKDNSAARDSHLAASAQTAAADGKMEDLLVLDSKRPPNSSPRTPSSKAELARSILAVVAITACELVAFLFFSKKWVLLSANVTADDVLLQEVRSVG